MSHETAGSLQKIAEQLERIATACERWAVQDASVGEKEVDWSAQAWRWCEGGWLQAIAAPRTLPLARLQGVERQKQKLLDNTRQFIQGRPANNVLLSGARGTGKSTLVRGLLAEFAATSLRMVEVPAQQLVELSELMALLGERDERFIVFADDLSFEAHDGSYKALKAVLDGSLAATPENVLIVVTSNRRHLLPEYQSDNQGATAIDGEIHHGEAVEEKISLSERFGLWLSFHPFDQAHFLAIAAGHLQAHGVAVAVEVGLEQPWEQAALQWALARGNRNGRTAEQFARDWMGRHDDDVLRCRA